MTADDDDYKAIRDYMKGQRFGSNSNPDKMAKFSRAWNNGLIVVGLVTLAVGATTGNLYSIIIGAAALGIDPVRLIK